MTGSRLLNIVAYRKGLIFCQGASMVQEPKKEEEVPTEDRANHARRGACSMF